MVNSLSIYYHLQCQDKIYITEANWSQGVEKNMSIPNRVPKNYYITIDRKWWTYYGKNFLIGVENYNFAIRHFNSKRCIKALNRLLSSGWALVSWLLTSDLILLKFHTLRLLFTSRALEHLHFLQIKFFLCYTFVMDKL